VREAAGIAKVSRMLRIAKQPVALTIAGSDSGGGAGIQADLKTFAALGVHGASAIACLTAQNPKRVLAVEPASSKILRRQIEAVFEELPPRAVKIGMLYSPENIAVVTRFFGSNAIAGRIPLIVDPVMISTSGARLLSISAEKKLVDQLLPRAALITPNLDEVAALLGWKPGSPDELRTAAREIQGRFGSAVLVKGGHLRRSREAIDIFFDGTTEMELSARFVTGVSTHGTGCTYSAAIAAGLALGHKLRDAIALAKKFVTAAIAESYRIGKHTALNQLATGQRPDRCHRPRPAR